MQEATSLSQPFFSLVSTDSSLTSKASAYLSETPPSSGMETGTAKQGSNHQAIVPADSFLIYLVPAAPSRILY